MSKTITRKNLFDFARLDDRTTSVASNPPPMPAGGGGLEKYQGDWNFATASHLLRRTTFGASLAQVREAADSSLEDLIEQLFEVRDLPDEPINFVYPNVPEIPLGESWVYEPYILSDEGDIPNPQQQAQARSASLRAWQLGLLFDPQLSIREKLTLFWHNHFVTELQIVRDPNLMYKYITTLREHATGNFKELVRLITIDPAMLIYLNGDENNVNAPNENYARELLELFTIGKGQLAGPGDYSTFTEDDVVAAAKVLTGWRVIGYRTDQGGEPYGRFISPQHDRSTKQFSHRFNNATIENNEENEYLDLIDMIFQQEEVSRYICRKLYRWFVYYDINEDVEANIIEPMAQMLRENNYDIALPLKTLLKSEHFFNICSVGPMIKNPLDFITYLFRQFEVALPDNNVRARYGALSQLNRVFEPLEMVYFAPPNVAGWKAYYQEPLFYRIWINSVTLANRQNITNSLTNGRYSIGDFRIRIDAVAFIGSLDNNEDVNQMIHEIANFIMPLGLTEEQKDYIKDILLPGLPDYEWNMEYDEYLNNPNDPAIWEALNIKLNNMLNAMFKMPEYYLS